MAIVIDFASAKAQTYNDPTEVAVACACADCDAEWSHISGRLFVPAFDALAVMPDANNRNAYAIIKRQRMIRLHSLMYSEVAWHGRRVTPT